MKAPIFQPTTTYQSLSRDTLFIDDMIAIINKGFQGGDMACPDTQLAKGFAISVALEFAFNQGVSFQGKMAPTWSSLRDKLFASCVKMVEAAGSNGDATADKQNEEMAKRLLNQLQQEKSEVGSTWSFILQADPELRSVVEGTIRRNTWSADIEAQEIYREILHQTHRLKLNDNGVQDKAIVETIFRHVYNACCEVISDRILDFALAVVEISGGGGGWPTQLAEIFQDGPKQAETLSMARAKFAIHAIIAFISSLPTTLQDEACVASLQSMMQEIKRYPTLTMRFACCDSISCENSSADISIPMIAKVVLSGAFKPWEFHSVAAAIHQLEEALGVQRDPALGVDKVVDKVVVKHESATPGPANVEVGKSQKNGNLGEQAHPRWMTFTDVMSLPHVAHIDNGGELHMFALQLEEMLFATCMNSQVETHKRLQVDVVTKKTLKLEAPEPMDKFFFAGKVSFGKKPKER